LRKEILYQFIKVIHVDNFRNLNNTEKFIGKKRSDLSQPTTLPYVVLKFCELAHDPCPPTSLTEQHMPGPAPVFLPCFY
jgi:hypothetical protein